MKRCPACKNLALQSFADPDTGLEIESCPSCLGLWFDAGELHRFFHSSKLTHRFLTPPGGIRSLTYDISEGQRHCPRCRTSMERPAVADVMVDVCRQCQGIWLDYGELDRIILAYRTRGLHGDAQVVDEVREGSSPVAAHPASLIEGALGHVASLLRTLFD